jgi:type II secretory pathway component PulC
VNDMSLFDDFLIVFWGFFMIGLMAIGGFFMFRKFLKQIPKQDGKSIMDWEIHYLEKTKHMWEENEKNLLEELVSPVPELFRDVARQKIASKIGEVALNKSLSKINQDVLIEGYILATPKRDHKFLRKKLKQKDIDVAPYENLFKLSKEDYRSNWQEQYKKNS